MNELHNFAYQHMGSGDVFYRSMEIVCFIPFNVPFKIISLISRRANRWVGRNGNTPGKPPDTPTSRTWLVSHVASAGLEPTPVTAVR